MLLSSKCSTRVHFPCIISGGNRYIPGGSQGSDMSGGSDPFTGGGRYIPGSSSTQTGSTGGGADPFTGSGRYVPSYNESQRSNPGAGGGGGDVFAGKSMLLALLSPALVKFSSLVDIVVCY